MNKIYFENPDVLVTESRCIVHGNVYALDQIQYTGVRLHFSRLRIFMTFVSMTLFLFAALAFIVLGQGVTYIITPDSRTFMIPLSPLFTGVSLLVTGFIVILLRPRQRYAIVINRGLQDEHIYITNRHEALAIVTAIDTAIDNYII